MANVKKITIRVIIVLYILSLGNSGFNAFTYDFITIYYENIMHDEYKYESIMIINTM